MQQGDYVECPWCRKGKTFISKGAYGWASILCGKCGKTYVVDFKQMTTEKSNAIRNQ